MCARLDFEAHYADLERRLSNGVDGVLERLHLLREDLQQMALKQREIFTSQPDMIARPSVQVRGGWWRAARAIATCWASGLLTRPADPATRPQNSGDAQPAQGALRDAVGVH